MADRRRSTHLLCGQIHFRELQVGDDEAIAALARRQHGAVARGQLLDIGLTDRAIDHRIATGRLRRVFAAPGARAVYAVGHEALSLTARAAAATLATGRGAATSHWTALALLDLIERPRRFRQTRSSWSREFPSPVVPRTLLDLSASCGERQLRTLLKRAEFKRRLQVGEVVAVLERYPRRRGRRALARVAAGFAVQAGPTQSPLEDDFLEFCGSRGLPLPETNVSLRAGGRVRIAGWRVVRVTSAQLRFAADELEADLRRLLRLPV